ncbi:hypothetical protein [Tateyamaria omphalii]|uniref:Uncharacterized protein n=1 Tax=Tateyamaria omphalii TaxID=299262 RepID=A0A1P8MYM8_9RHOB|nr:hypothetical protein [Tateyamaria omphalii]APX13197.1 hypothetical protein BWR18_17035 [Tateyamaria omphalii]
MSTLTLTPIKMRHGVWQALIQQNGTGVPQIKVTHQDTDVPDVKVTEQGEDGGWLLHVPIPPEAIADGVQVFVITDGTDDEKLGDFTIIAGEALGDDIRGEVALLRQELDMLKRAFRRHCVETT